MKWLIPAFLAALSWFVPAQSAAQGWEALEAPDAIVLMRHALAPGGGDPAGFRLENCNTQRNLSRAGRAQAETIGAELRARGVVFDKIWSSAWCRCQDTATLLGLGAVQVEPSLNSFFGGQGDRLGQTAATLSRLSQSKGRRMLVTHQVNITALTGIFPQSGEMIVVEMQKGQLAVTGRILIAPPE